MIKLFHLYNCTFVTLPFVSLCQANPYPKTIKNPNNPTKPSPKLRKTKMKLLPNLFNQLRIPSNPVIIPKRTNTHLPQLSP